MKKSILKVPGGKLLKVFLDSDNNQINKIRITGDFFAHPEESIEMLEKELAGKELNQESLANEINSFFRQNNVKLFGIDTENLVKAILGCLNE